MGAILEVGSGGRGERSKGKLRKSMKKRSKWEEEDQNRTRMQTEETPRRIIQIMIKMRGERLISNTPLIKIIINIVYTCIYYYYI